MKNKGWHLTLSKADTQKTVNLRLPQNSGLLFGVFAVVFFILFTFSLVYIYNNQNKIVQAQKVLNENDLLKQKLSNLSNIIDSINIKLKNMEDWEDQMRVDQNFKKIKKDIRELGIGGFPRIDTSFFDYNKELNIQYNLVANKLIQTTNKLDFDYQTHLELLENIQLKESLFRNTPSIYPTYGRISDGYGWRIHPISKRRIFHYGLDIANNKNTCIYATADGVVANTRRKKNLGKYVKLKHKFGYETKYAHLQKIIVKHGQTVKRGEIIGYMGRTGRTTGTHLHYEVLRYGKYRNPYKYLNKSKEDIILTKS
ncbi:MAG: M23 family metallopeptidase [Candidatus Cloacimonetes bacterium]|nr:M23 family metallopeptidase [Candidatus Cloacimonadota bacterium]